MPCAKSLHEFDVFCEIVRVQRSIVSFCIGGCRADWNLHNLFPGLQLVSPPEICAAQVFADIVPLIAGRFAKKLVSHAV